MSPRTHVILAFGIAFSVPFLADLLYLAIAPNAAVSRWGYGVTKAFLILWPFVAARFLLRGTGSSPDSGSGSRRHVVSLVLGAVLGLAIAGGMLGLMRTPIGDHILDGSGIIQEKMALLGWKDHFLFWSILISLVHSALEEYYWRWFGYGKLSRHLPGWRAHVLAAIAFSLHHYVILWVYFSPWMALWLGTMVAVGGLLWSLLYSSTRSLLGPWISHVIVDLAIFSIGWRLLNI